MAVFVRKCAVSMPQVCRNFRMAKADGNWESTHENGSFCLCKREFPGTGLSFA